VIATSATVLTHVTIRQRRTKAPPRNRREAYIGRRKIAGLRQHEVPRAEPVTMSEVIRLGTNANMSSSVHSVSALGPSDSSPDTPIADFRVRAVPDDEWEIVAWLWQAYRNDLSDVVKGLPYANGRYQSARLARYPSPNAAGYLAWRAHPTTGEDAPIAFAVIEGLVGDRRSIEGFWVAPAARREGTGRKFALDVLSRHEGPWTIVFQHDNVGASHFWRSVAEVAFGSGRWSEEERAVPGLPDVPPDHFVFSL
jgi:hypothetical protein